MNLIGRLQTVSDAYCDLRQLRREQVSYRIFADQRRLGLVFGGGSGLTVANYEKAMGWFSGNWPEEAEWPTDVERPAPAEQSIEAAE